MDVRLARDRQLVALAASGLADLTRGVEHPRLDTARTRLRDAEIALGRRAGRRSAWARTRIAALVIGAGVWITAAVARNVIGLHSGWVITAAGAAFLAVSVLAHWMNDVLYTYRRRGIAQAVDEGVPSSFPEVIWLSERARDGIRDATRLRLATHRFASAARTADGFNWLRRIDPYLFDLSLADRCLCQAIDSLEIWMNRRDADAPDACEAHS
jgi:hypothetical protein